MICVASAPAWTGVCVCVFLLHVRAGSMPHSESGTVTSTVPVGLRLLVEIPFVSADREFLLRSHRLLWPLLPPCSEPMEPRRAGRHDAQPDLLFLFNGDCRATNNACDAVRDAWLQSMPDGARRCFGKVLVRDARLTGFSNTYDKKRKSAKWTAGPNNMFYRAVDTARSMGYTHMLQMEPDVLPLRRNWLSRAQNLAAISDAWLIGSALHAACTRDEQSGACVSDLPDEIAEHINGNAIYAVGDPSFYSYLQDSRRGHRGRMPFDLALHTLRSSKSQGERRQLLHRFQHSSFVINFGTSLPDGGARMLRSQFPNSYLMHSSALGRLDDDALRSALSPPSDSEASEWAPSDGHAVHLDMTVLQQRAAVFKDGTRGVMVTFAAGRRYRALCENHILHLRRAQVQHYALVALDAPSFSWLSAAGEHVVDASKLIGSLPDDGSDAFGSNAFFAINGARYRALLQILEARLSVFVLDLDVVILRDPLQWIHQRMLAGNLDVMLQSDARDGVSLVEQDPDLILRRLELHGVSNWSYANGGTLFCRATNQAVALLTRVLKRLSESTTPPNEQDVMNSELSRVVQGTDLRWGLLPPVGFPNGFVYFLRPLVEVQDPFLVHANWIDGVDAKAYHMREAGLWLLDRPPTSQGNMEKLLSIGDGTDGGPQGALSISAHIQAVGNALAIAHALNRTLVLPRLPVSSKSRQQTRTFAHFFDYGAFRAAFPRHRALGPRGATGVAKGVHIDIGRGDAPDISPGYEVPPAHTLRSIASEGLTDVQLQRAMEPFADVPHVRLWTSFRRMAGFASASEGRDFHLRLLRGLKPAARLQSLVQYLYRTLRRRFGAFDCVDASEEQEYAALLTSSEGIGVEPISVSGVLHGAAQLINRSSSKAGSSTAGLPSVLVVGSSRRSGATATSEVRATAQRVFRGRTVIWMEEHVPAWYVTDYDAQAESETHARALVESRLCVKARRFVGNLAAPSTHSICRWRAQAKASSDHANGARTRSPPCKDALGRALPRGVLA